MLIGVAHKAMPSPYAFYYEAKQKAKTTQLVYLEEQEEEDRRNDYAEVKGMKDHHRDQHENWNKAGNFYNIIQTGEGADAISRYAVGLSRTIIDSGHSMMNEGEPEGAYKPIGPGNRKISVLWDALVKHNLEKSNWRAHQNLWTKDLLIFGSSPLEAFVNPVIRRPGEEPGLFLIRLATQARVGLRHRSIWYSFRNANVIDPDEVPSCAWEEVITHAVRVSKYQDRPDFIHMDQIPVASKYKLTHVCNEHENTYRIYMLPFGTMAEAAWEENPNDDELGFPVYRQKLTSLNPLGMCPLSFGIFGDQLTPDYKHHALYGMGIPQLIEGMEMIMEGLFNMTVDNLRLKNTVPVGYTPYTGQSDFPDLDSIGVMESGRVYPGTFDPQSLGIADIRSNTVMWEWINNLCIWLTGLNFQQLGGDTSKTAYEFAQRLKANSQRSLSRLKALENGPMKRSWTLMLANSLGQIRKDEWEDVTDVQAEEIAKLIKDGRAATNDYKIEKGVIKAKRFVEYFPVNDYHIEENFKKSKKRKLDTNTADNTIEFKPQKGAISMVPAVSEYLFPSGNIAHMMAFTVDVVSKTMLGDLTVHDQEAIDKVLNQGATLMQVVPDITPKLMFTLWKQGAEKAGLDIDAALEDEQDSPALKKAKEALQKMEQLRNTPPQPNAQAPQPPLAQPPRPTQGLPTGGSPTQLPGSGVVGVQTGTL